MREKTVFFLLLILLAGCPVLAFGKPLAALFLEHEQASPWTDELRSGLEQGGRDFGFETEVFVVAPGPQQEQKFREVAAKAALVLVATDNFHEILRNNAANFRRVKFGCLDAAIRAPNIMSVTFADEQASFLAGVAAAMLAKSEMPQTAASVTVGWLSGMDTPAMRSLLAGFGEGAHLAVPDAAISQALCRSFTSPEVAATKTRWLKEHGASVIALAAGAGNSGALKETGPADWFIALDGALPERSLGVILKRTARAVHEIMESAASGKFRGKEIITYDLANKGVDFELSPSFTNQHRHAANIARRLAELRGEIAKKSIVLRSMRQRTLCDCLN